METRFDVHIYDSSCLDEWTFVGGWVVVALLVLEQSGRICPFSVSPVVTPGELYYETAW